MKKVLLTGASGFIGRGTIPLMLKQGYEVHAVSRTAHVSGKQEPSLFWHQCDLLNNEQQQRLFAKVEPTHLLHFAWCTTPGKYWTSLDNLLWVQASLNLMMNFAKQGGKRAVLAGTCAEYDWSYGYCSEKITPTHPSSLYGTCKHSLQEILRHLSRQTDLSSAWGRIFFVYGPHEHPSRFVPTAVRALLKRESPPRSHNKQIRDFLFVNDVASAFVNLLGSPIEGPVNIASGEPVTLEFIIEFISRRLKHPGLVEVSAKAVSTNEPLLLVADISRLSQELRWKPKYSLEEGLLATIDWWRKHLESL